MDSHTETGLASLAGQQRDESVEQLMSQLNSGMSSCRKVVDHYRAVLSERQELSKRVSGR